MQFHILRGSGFCSPGNRWTSLRMHGHSKMGHVSVHGRRELGACCTLFRILVQLQYVQKIWSGFEIGQIWSFWSEIFGQKLGFFKIAFLIRLSGSFYWNILNALYNLVLVNSAEDMSEDYAIHRSGERDYQPSRCPDENPTVGSRRRKRFGTPVSANKVVPMLENRVENQGFVEDHFDLRDVDRIEVSAPKTRNNLKLVARSRSNSNVSDISALKRVDKTRPEAVTQVFKVNMWKKLIFQTKPDFRQFSPIYIVFLFFFKINL